MASQPLEIESKISQYLERIRPQLNGTIFAFIVGGFMIFLTGFNPFFAYQAMLSGAFGSANSIAETLVRSIPLMLTAMGMTIALKAKAINIGGEGQVYMGAIFGAVTAVTLRSLPSVIIFPLSMLAGFLGGGLWAAVPGILKTELGISEILSSMIMNFIAISFTGFLVQTGGPFHDPASAGQPASPRIPLSVDLPRIWPSPFFSLPFLVFIGLLIGIIAYTIFLERISSKPRRVFMIFVALSVAILIYTSFVPSFKVVTRLHAGIFIALASISLTYFFLEKTTWGYRIKAVGANAKAARVSGINVRRTVLVSMLLSGGFAGLAGMVEIFGIEHRVLEGFSIQYGYTGMMIALVGRLNALGAALMAFLFSAIVVGADTMSREVGTPHYVAFILQGLIVLFVVAFEHVELQSIIRIFSKKGGKQNG